VAYLRRIDDPSVRYELVGRRVSVGREELNDIVMEADIRVSRRHATIDMREGRWVISDDRSANGTYVNGQRVTSRVLREGDRIRFGATTVVFVPAADPRKTLTEEEPFLRGTWDRVLVTVMFTDIVDSTIQVSSMGDREWRRILESHDAIVDAEIERCRGRKIKATGDGALAVFDAPARGISCAMGIRSSTAQLGMSVRAGLHTGEVELRQHDIAGIAVHVAERVAALARPGDVLVSRTSSELVAGSGFSFEDRGEHALKGVRGRWQLYAVSA
jgi:class 3 adenylate cyclase